MLNKNLMRLCQATILLLLTSYVVAKPVESTLENPLRKALELSDKYMPKALINMWQTEHLTWRAQLFGAACGNKLKKYRVVSNASYRLVNDFIIDQAIINDGLSDVKTTLALHDISKLHYRIFSEIYGYAYIRRLRLIQHYHPEVKLPLCQYAEEMSKKFPVDDMPTLPWKVTNLNDFSAFKADLFSMSVLNRYFIPAFINRQKPFSHIIDAKIYAQILENKAAVFAFTDFTISYKYRQLLINEISKVYKQKEDRDLNTQSLRFHYIQTASRWAEQAYGLATASALMQVKAKYPDHYQKIKAHMNSYLNLKLSGIGKSEIKLAEIFNQPSV